MTAAVQANAGVRNHSHQNNQTNGTNHSGRVYRQVPNEEQLWEELFNRCPGQVNRNSQSKALCKQRVKQICEDAIKKYPDLDPTDRTIFQFISNCFEKAVRSCDYRFAKKLLSQGAEIHVSRFDDFTVTNPALKEIPELFTRIREVRDFISEPISVAYLNGMLELDPDYLDSLVFNNRIAPSALIFGWAIDHERTNLVNWFFANTTLIPSNYARLVARNDIARVTTLLQRGAKPYDITDFSAFNAENINMTNLLISRGAKVTQNVAEEAARRQDRPVCQWIISNYPEYGWWMLEAALKANLHDMAQYLKGLGARLNCNSYDILGWIKRETPKIENYIEYGNFYGINAEEINQILFYVRDRQKALSMINKIIAHGIHPNTKSLALAVDRNDKGLIEAILGAGVRPTQNTYKLARERLDPETLQWLEQTAPPPAKFSRFEMMNSIHDAMSADNLEHLRDGYPDYVFGTGD